MDDDRRFQLISRVVDGGFKIGGTLIVAGAVVCVARYLRDVLVAFAGHDTNANILVSLFAQIQLDRWLAYLLAGSGLGYGIRERKLRQRAIRRLTERPLELEKRLDPDRTSSGLTPEGRTRHEDR